MENVDKKIMSCYTPLGNWPGPCLKVKPGDQPYLETRRDEAYWCCLLLWAQWCSVFLDLDQSVCFAFFHLFLYLCLKRNLKTLKKIPFGRSLEMKIKHKKYIRKKKPTAGGNDFGIAGKFSITQTATSLKLNLWGFQLFKLGTRSMPGWSWTSFGK